MSDIVEKTLAEYEEEIYDSFDGVPYNEKDNMTVKPCSDKDMIVKAHRWMLEICCHLSPLQLRDLGFQAERMGISYWHLYCLQWDSFKSDKNSEAAYPLSKEVITKNKDNEHTYDMWKCIFHFLMTHPRIFAAFSEVFKWNNCEMILRIGRHYPDMFALTSGPIDIISEKLANRLWIKLPVDKPDKYVLAEYNLEAAFRKIDTENPEPMKKNRELKIDLHLPDGWRNFNPTGFSSDADDIEDADSPPSKRIFRKRKGNRELFSPLLITPTCVKRQKLKDTGIGAILAAAKDDMSAVVGPRSPLVNTSGSSDSSTLEVADTPESPIIPCKKEFSKKSPTKAKNSDAIGGSSEKPITVADSPTWQQKRAAAFVPLGKKIQVVNPYAKTGSSLAKAKGGFKKLGEAKRRSLKPASASTSRPKKAAATKTARDDCGLELTQNGSYICD